MSDGHGCPVGSEDGTCPIAESVGHNYFTIGVLVVVPMLAVVFLLLRVLVGRKIHFVRVIMVIISLPVLLVTIILLMRVLVTVGSLLVIVVSLLDIVVAVL